VTQNKSLKKDTAEHLCPAVPSKHREGTSRKPKVTALPQYEARAHPTYFDFFFGAFFFFVAMAVMSFFVRT
jgi:hypothetical protein